MAGVRLPPWLWSIVVAFAFVNAAFAAGMQTLGPVVADETVGRAAWGLVLAAQAAGMVLGGLLALRVRFRRRRPRGLRRVLGRVDAVQHP